MATSVKRSALLPFTAAAVFEIVNDVVRYPEFLPGIRAVEVLEESAREVVASMSFSARGLAQPLTTRNVLTPHERIDLELVSGPLRALSGCWSFTGIGEQGCRVQLDLEVQLSALQALGGALGGMSLSRIADQIVDAFCSRARTLLS